MKNSTTTTHPKPARHAQQPLSVNELKRLSGKLIFQEQDAATSTYLVLAEADKNYAAPTKVTPKKAKKSYNLLEDLLLLGMLVALTSVFISLVGH